LYSIHELDNGWAVYLNGKRISRKVHCYRMDAQHEMVCALRRVGVITHVGSYEWDIWDDAANELCNG
jgi:hypothetical protein